MKKTSKKVEKEEPQALLLDPEPAPVEEIESPDPSTTPAEEEPEKESTSEGETIVENVEPEPKVKGKTGPKPKGFIDNDPTVLDRLNALPTWEGVWAYVYRIQPFSNRLVGGNRKIHVRRYDAPFDVQTLMEEAGSGVYQIQATRLQPATGKRPMFDSGEIRILNQNYPPKIPPGEWVDDPRNKEWAWAKQAIFAEINKKEPAAPVVDPLVEILREQIRAQREELQQVRAQIGQKDPNEQTLLTAIAQRLMQPPPPPPDPMQALAAAVQLLKSMQPPPPPPREETALEKIASKLLEEKLLGKGEQTDIAKLIEMKKQFDELTPPTRNGRKDGWDHAVEMVEAVGPILGPALQPIGQILAHRMMMGPQQPPQPGAQQPPQQPQLPTLPEALQQPQQQPRPNLHAVPEKPTVQAFSKAILEHLQKDWSGLDLGDWYLKKYGPQEFEDIRNQGKDEVIGLLKSVPESWTPLEPYQKDGKLEPMIEEFLDWEPEPEQQKEAQSATAAAANNNNLWNNPAPVGVEVQQQ